MTVHSAPTLRSWMRMGALSLVVIAALSASSAAFAEDPAPFQIIPSDLEYLVRSTLALEDGNLDQAAKWAEALFAEDPRSSYAASRFAQILEQAGDDARALEWGGKALERDSTNADAAMLVGRMRLRAGEASMAVKALTPPLRVLGARPELYALRALAHELDKNYEAALADLRRTGELLPDFAWVASGVLGMALEDGRLDEASQALQLALEITPNDPRSLGLGVELARRLGDAALEEKLLSRRAEAQDAVPEQIAAYASYLFREGSRKAAEAFLGRMAQRGFDPNDARIEAGRALVREGDYRAALEAVKPLGEKRAALPIKARALMALGDEKPALACFRKAADLRPVASEDSVVVAYLEIKVGDRKRGILILEGIREQLLGSPRRLLAGALCYIALRQPKEAVTLMREGASRGSESPMLYAELGQTAVSIGDSLVAEWAFQKLNSLGRENSECLYFLAASDLNQGAMERAVQRLGRAVELDPHNGRALALLGSIHYSMGQLELARDVLRRAVRCRDAGPEAERTLGRVCRALRLDSEAKAAESRARGKPTSPDLGLTFFSKP